MISSDEITNFLNFIWDTENIQPIFQSERVIMINYTVEIMFPLLQVKA